MVLLVYTCMTCERVGLAAARCSEYSAAERFLRVICWNCERFRARDFFEAFIKWFGGELILRSCLERFLGIREQLAGIASDLV